MESYAGQETKGNRESLYSLILLAGGKSSRMGRDKAGLAFQGGTFLETLLEKGKRQGIHRIYISGHKYLGRDGEAVPDRYENRGPLGGIHSCMEQAHTPYCLVLPVDVPQIPMEVLDELLDVHESMAARNQAPPVLLLEHGGRKEPLIGIYGTWLKRIIEEEIKAGPCSVFHVLDKTGYEVFSREIPWETIENINTPQTYEQVLEKVKGNACVQNVRLPMKIEIELEEAVSQIQKAASLLTRTRLLPVEEAGGFVLAKEILAELDNPPFSRSPVDGYAVRTKDLQGADRENPARLKVLGWIYAGDDAGKYQVGEGEAVGIMTGAPFPKGCDGAVRQEDTDYGEEQVAVYTSLKPYENYCFQGEDYERGSLLLKKGSVISFAEQGILAGIGRTQVLVFDKPRIRVITTGDELWPGGSPLPAGKIYDSNGMMVSCRLKELGVVPVSLSHEGDDASRLAESLEKACRDADIVITTGGVSVGKKDILHQALPLLGAEQIFWKVNIKPGAPTIFSKYKDTLILSLSGNPFGAMANMELLLRPMLEALTGDARYAMERREGIFQSSFPKSSKGRRFVRGIYKDGQVTLPQGIYSSGAVGSLRGCNCLMDISPGKKSVEKGEKVTVWML